MPGALRITRISLPVADLAAAIGFYEGALGFEFLRRETRAGPALAALIGEDGVRAEAAILQLGEQEIELVAFDPPGAAYPAARTAADPWFQHFAIVVADMAAAYARLQAVRGWAPISRGGPQLLPPSTGSVTAFKFRDPDGHPLELSFFAAGATPRQWRGPHAGRLFLGVDHSGIAVADLPASLAFYRDRLGLAAAPTLVNAGPTQARLDGLADPVVDIVAVFPETGPHIELLAYRGRAAPPATIRPRDIAATQLVIAVDDLDALAARLTAAGTARISRGEGGVASLFRDPDGHLLRFETAA